MSRPLVALLFIISVIATVLFVAIEPQAALVAQVPTEPDFPICTEGLQPLLQFGPGELVRPNELQDSFNFIAPTGVEPAGQVLIWQGEGHLWDDGCNAGPNNDDPSRVPPCDQQQLLEVLTVTVNGDAIGQFIDHSPDTDQNYFYTFDFNNLVEGNNTLDLIHLN